MNHGTLHDRLATIRERIANAAKRSGRQPEQITLLGVSKTYPAEAIREAFAAGVRHFGENRVQEWEGKRGGTEDLAGYWHLIGHLQSNKAARAAKAFDAVDSVDDFALAQRLDRARAEISDERKLRVLIEVRVAAEETKSGGQNERLPERGEKLLMFERLDLAGLMCVPQFLENVEKVRP